MSNLIGQTLLNQYRVDSFVASGGMGAVYRVIDINNGTAFAMKALHADLADDPTVFKRFQREAQALQQLKHPNIIPFHGLYQERGTTFLLEDFIKGSSLQEILKKNRTLPINEVLTYMKGVCAGLGYAHSKKIAHCDIKPGNVMVSTHGNIYLADFGIARFIGATTTTTLGIAGTPSYMAPEQILGHGITHLTDIYALGVMLFEMLAGQRPFRGTEPGTEAGGSTPSDRICYGHLRMPPPNPRQINAAISPALARVVLCALEKNPINRFQSAQEFFNEMCAAVQLQPRQISDETTIIGTYIEPPHAPVPSMPNAHQPSSNRVQLQRNIALVLMFVIFAIVSAFGAALLINGAMLKPVSDPPTISSAPPIFHPTATSVLIIDPLRTGATETNTPAPPTKITVPTQTDDPSLMTSSEQEVSDFVENYWQKISNKEFEDVWQFQSAAFKKKNNPKGIKSFINGFQYTKSIEILRTEVVSANSNFAVVDVDLKFFITTGGSTTSNLQCSLFYRTNTSKNQS